MSAKRTMPEQMEREMAGGKMLMPGRTAQFELNI